MFIVDENKERLLSHGDGEVLPRLIALAANAENSEIQYNCAGTIGQLTLTGRCGRSHRPCCNHHLYFICIHTAVYGGYSSDVLGQSSVKRDNHRQAVNSDFQK